MLKRASARGSNGLPGRTTRAVKREMREIDDIAAAVRADLARARDLAS
ncbi:MAG: hypothetical protein ABIW50_07585 [Candidatus Limnocylindria bacterium]